MIETLFANFATLASAPNAVTELRELVLRLAVRAKLVAQDNSEEPASVLVARIFELKGKSTLDVESPPYEIPNSWNWVRFDDLVKFEMGKTPNTKTSAYWETDDNGFPWVSIADMPTAGFVENTAKRVTGKAVAEVFKRAPAPTGTLLMSFKLSIGKIALLKTDAYHNEAIISIFPFLQETQPYLFHCLRGIDLFSSSKSAIKGNTLNSTSLRSLLIPLPPLEEQRRIVEQVNKLMRLCDELDGWQKARRKILVSLNNAALAPLNKSASLTREEFQQATTRLADKFDTLYDSVDTLGKLRSMILQLAVQGKLVPCDPSDSPALVNGGVIPTSLNGFDQRSNSDLDGAISVPPHWTIQPLERVAAKIVDCPHSTPKWTAEGKICVRTNQFRPGYLDLSSNRFVSNETYRERIQRLKPTEDDILYSREGGILGVACRVPPNTELCLGQRMMLIRTGANADPEFVEMVLNSPLVREIAKAKTTGGAAPRVNVATVKAFPIPIPPFAEQKRIVAKVNQLMSLCDQLETKLRQAEADSEKLMNAAVQHVLTTISHESAIQSDLEQTALLC